jgi:hypothetical protein
MLTIRSTLKPNDVCAVASVSYLTSSAMLGDIDMENRRTSFIIARLIVPIVNIIAPILKVCSIPRILLPFKYFLGHPQQLHKTSHGSMKRTKWIIENDGEAVIHNRRYTTGDEGIALLCTIVCSETGRHVHVDQCRAPPGQCGGEEELEHITGATGHRGREVSECDWVAHRLFWDRTGA